MKILVTTLWAILSVLFLLAMLYVSAAFMWLFLMSASAAFLSFVEEDEPLSYQEFNRKNNIRR